MADEEGRISWRMSSGIISSTARNAHYVDAPKPKPFYTKSRKHPSFPRGKIQFHPSEFSAMTGALICCLPVLPLLPLPLEFLP